MDAFDFFLQDTHLDELDLFVLIHDKLKFLSDINCFGEIFMPFNVGISSLGLSLDYGEQGSCDAAKLIMEQKYVHA